MITFLRRVPKDQLIYLTCQMMALCSGALYFNRLKNCKDRVKKQLIGGLLGFVLCILCFRSSTVHLIVQVLIFQVCFLGFSNEGSCELRAVITLIALMAHLSFLHLKRMRGPLYLRYAYDITGPIMISTQKLTHLAFAVVDKSKEGKKDGELSVDQELQAVNKPNIIGLFGYVFAFHNVLSGPACFYADYDRFLAGKTSNRTHSKLVTIKLCQAVFFAFCYSILSSKFDVKDNVLPSGYVSLCDLPRAILFLVQPFSFADACFSQSSRYYVAWKLSEAVNLISGFGLVVEEEESVKVHELVKNVCTHRIEFGTSFKMMLDAWNIQTIVWLRRICYDRLKGRKGRTLATHLLSALWHGFYPGYYLAFASAALVSYAGRGWRRKIRPIIVKNARFKMYYDVLTWFCAMTAANYCVMPFVMLELKMGLRFFIQYRFAVHAFCALICLTTPCASLTSTNVKLKK